MATSRSTVRNLVLVFGDQLDARSAAFDGFDRAQDAVLMIESAHEATYVPQHQHRLVLFFSAMRHFRDALRKKGVPVHYAALDDRATRPSFGEEVPRWLRRTRAERLIAVQPGDHRVSTELERTVRGAATLDVRPDRHFLCSDAEFADYAEGRATLLLETFYRGMRRRHDVLMEGAKPRGGQWNFDADNRAAFGPEGPGAVPAPLAVRPDATTREVAALVRRRFGDGPGSTDGFALPVTRTQARRALSDFVEHRLPSFGRYQDAMAVGEPYLYHSRLSTSLNLHLLDPRDAIAAAVRAFETRAAPLASVEGFVRQILGWREFVRGIYWREMPDYAERNALGADLPMPAFMWTAETDMQCVRHCVGQLREHAYAHHIQRLMVLGLFSLLLGVRPQEVNRWHLAMYVDAIDWVSLPNVLGMSQYADGGLVATKPYCASGAYIRRMSPYCDGCRFVPRKAVGDDACPFTTLYWDFLARHRRMFQKNHRMRMQLKNLERKSRGDVEAIRAQADRVKRAMT